MILILRKDYGIQEEIVDIDRDVSESIDDFLTKNDMKHDIAGLPTGRVRVRIEWIPEDDGSYVS